MIVLLRFRSLMLFTLVILAVSFIYIGYGGFSGQEKEVDLSTEPPKEIHEPVQVFIDIDNKNPIDQPTLVSEMQESKTNDTFFAEFRMKRDRGRDGQIELLREIINNPQSSPTVRDEAQVKLIEIADNKANEMKTENILRAKGYNEIVVVVEKNKATVIARQMDLNPLDIVRISDLITRTIEVKIEDIAIIPKE